MTDETVETVEQKFARWAYVIDAQAKEIDRLRAEVARLTEGADAHSTLQSIYRDRDLPESLRAKAATAALPVEKGKMPTAFPLNDVDRKQRWMAYERFVLQKQILEQTRQLPPAGWDAKLVEGVYEAPAGDGEPPMDLYGRDAITAHVAISELMVRNRRNGGSDGGGDDSSSKPTVQFTMFVAPARRRKFLSHFNAHRISTVR